ncbi:hypothetical protein TWF481_008134 [Arthrobotrys musiformis]|uniref:Peptidase S8/S53 domain-containing protein n=1 Tax=Arthrobotrys musiformis TaxID=47236 RepID=A0AAV9W849_9PEZI
MSKIGTWEKGFIQAYFIIKSEHRLDTQSVNEVANFGRKYAVTPRDQAVYFVRSELLGTWIVVVDVWPMTGDTAVKFSKECQQKLKHLVDAQVFGLFEKGNGVGYYARGDTTPSWMDASKVLSKRQDDGESGEPSGRKDKRSPVKADTRIKVTGAGVGDNMSKADIIPVRSENVENLIISQPPGVSIKEMNGLTYHERGAGSGVVVYVVDSGIDLSHKYFEAYRNQFMSDSSLNWLYSGPMPSDERNDDGRPFKGFGNSEPVRKILYTGTVTASKIVGEAGIAPYADIVAVKLHTGRNTMNWINDIDCFLKIFDHYKLLHALDPYNELGFKGAVVVAGPGSNTDNLEGQSNKVREGSAEVLLREALYFLGRLNAHVFYSNVGKKENAFKFPRSQARRALGMPLGYLQEGDVELAKMTKAAIIGIADSEDGTKAIDKELPHLVKLYAPGIAAAPWLFDHYRGNPQKLPFINQVTSRYVSALAGGVCAVLISRGWEDPLKRMETIAYKRSDSKDSPKVIWNGINLSTWEKALKAYDVGKGGASGSGGGK